MTSLLSKTLHVDSPARTGTLTFIGPLPRRSSARRVCTCARQRKGSGTSTDTQRGAEQGSEFREAASPSPPHQGVQQRTAYVSATAIVLGLMTVALWNAQHWRLPWQRKGRRSSGDAGVEPLQVGGVAVVDADAANLAAIVDDQPPRRPEEKRELEVARLQAARVALERRYSQLDASKDRREGILAPFIPPSDRPWRDGVGALDKVQPDPSADMSLQWPGQEQVVSGVEAELQKELDEVPREQIDAEQAEIKEALSQLQDYVVERPDATKKPDTDTAELEGGDLPGLGEELSIGQEPVLPKASDRAWAVEERTEQDLETGRDSGIQEEPTTSPPPEADDEAAPLDDREQAPSRPGQRDEAADSGAEEGIAGPADVLPELTRAADDVRESSLLPKASNLDFREDPATVQEVEEIRATTAAPEAETVGKIRRSQKPVPVFPGQLRLVAAGACIPAASKIAAGKGGEDAFFVSESLWGAIGVADGVGGWTEDGIDPSHFSRMLMETAAAATEHGWGRSKNQGARGLMHIAQTGAMDIRGTSTCCIALMMSGKTLQIANLGDSGFMIFRDAKCLFESEIQQHSFNCPYQAGSPKLMPNSNTADDAAVYELDLKAGDIVVMATDGVFDNLFTSDLEDIIGAFMTADKHTTLQDKAEALALTIARVASARGNDPSAKTPWIQEAVRMVPEMLPWHKRLRPRGGKPDDSTAVVAFMEPDETQY